MVSPKVSSSVRNHVASQLAIRLILLPWLRMTANAHPSGAGSIIAVVVTARYNYKPESGIGFTTLKCYAQVRVPVLRRISAAQIVMSQPTCQLALARVVFSVLGLSARVGRPVRRRWSASNRALQVGQGKAHVRAATRQVWLHDQGDDRSLGGCGWILRSGQEGLGERPRQVSDYR